MGEKGQVISVDGDKAMIRLQRTEACAKCGGCIAGMSTSDMMMDAKNECDAKIDDWVNIEIENKFFLKAVIIMNVIPLIFLISGFVLGILLGEFLGFEKYKELIGFTTGIILMIFSYLLIKKREGHFKKEDYSPKATYIVPVDKLGNI